MGTRGFIGVKIDGKIKGSYNHFDSYPDGLGQDVVDFCNKVKKDKKWSDFKEAVKKVELVDENSHPNSEQINRYKGYSDCGVGSQSLEDWYCLLRDVQGIAMFEETLNSVLRHWIDGINFLKDSLFCEYAYIVNVDDMTLEFYEGFNQKPDKNSPLPFEQVCSREYYPVLFKGSCPLNKIPENFEKEFYG